MAAVRLALVAAMAALILSGCDAGGGKIEPSASAKSGSPILNRDKAPRAPGN